jgi:Fe-S-cluster containining protein
MPDEVRKLNSFLTKWQGKADIDNDDFWNECIDTYRAIGQYRLTLPWVDVPETRAQAQTFLHCPLPCGDCCKFGLEAITYEDAKRIIDGTGMTWKEFAGICTLLQHEGKDLTYAIKGAPCPFLKDGLCSIYEFRPQVCRDYPIVRPTFVKGSPRLTVSTRCNAGANMGREMIRLHLKLAGGQLTPNLMIREETL